MYNKYNSCYEQLNLECESGYSLYFPCLKTITNGENTCFEFYLADNANKEEIDLREVDDITLNMSGRYNCDLGSYSYPDNIKSLQFEKFTKNIYNIDFSEIILNHVKLYIDIVDENNKLIESHLYDDKEMLIDIAIYGTIGYFLNGSDDENGILNLTGYDTRNLIFLGWFIDDNDENCELENKYDYLINDKNLNFYVNEDCIIRAVYRIRRTYGIYLESDRNTFFTIYYMGNKYEGSLDGYYFGFQEGHDVKITCEIQNNQYIFDKWSDGYQNPYRVLNIGNIDNVSDFVVEYNDKYQLPVIHISAQYKLNDDSEQQQYIDNIDINSLNIFNSHIYPKNRTEIFIEKYFINNIFIDKCEIDILNGEPYIRINKDGYIQIDDINESGNVKLLLNRIGKDCILSVNNNVILPSVVDKNEYIFEYNGGVLKLEGEDSCIFGLKINKEVIYDKGKCALCLNSEETLKLHVGDITVEGGVIVNGNPYGISPVKIGKVSEITPLIIKK